MAKARKTDDVAASIAAFIGKSMGTLAGRRDALQKELAAVDRQIASVRDGVMRSLGAREIPFPKRKAKVAKKAVKRFMSPEARSRMAAAAKRRWAAAKKAGKNSLG